MWVESVGKDAMEANELDAILVDGSVRYVYETGPNADALWTA